MEIQIADGQIIIGEQVMMQGGDLDDKNKEITHGRKVPLETIRTQETKRQERMLRLKPSQFCTNADIATIEHEYQIIDLCKIRRDIDR